MFKTVVILTGA